MCYSYVTIKRFFIIFFFLLPLNANAGNFISNAADKLGDFINDGLKTILETSEQTIQAIFGHDGLIEEGLKDVEDVAKNCLLRINVDDCGSAIESTLFGASCRIVKVGTGMGLNLLDSTDLGTTNLGDVVAYNNLYPAVILIFDQDLNTPNFSSYVKKHVKFYRSEAASFVGNSRAEERAVYFKSSNPSPSLIIHELTHIWQYYTGGLNSFSNDYCDEVMDKGGLPGYDFYLDMEKTLTDYGIEQQAQIVENYYLYSEGIVTGCGHDSNFRNCTSFGNITDSLSAVVSSTAVNPIFTETYAAYPTGGTKVAEFNDPIQGNKYNNCSFKTTYGTGGMGYEYMEYEIACTTGIYKLGVEKTYSFFSPYTQETCKFHDLGSNIYGSGSCNNWRVYSY